MSINPSAQRASTQAPSSPPPSPTPSTQASSSLPPSLNIQTSENPFSEEEHELHTDLFRIYDLIYKHLKWAGFPGNYHAFSRVVMFRREVFRVSDPGLHLVWQKDMYFIKPLPSCFNGAGAGEKIDFDRLGPLIRGLFFSYTRLIPSELDFDIALEHKVLPKNFSGPGGWTHWQTLVEDYAVHVTAAQAKRKAGGKPGPDICPDECPRRYRFGALRLGRLNWIMWLTRPNAKDYFFHTRHPVNTFWSGYGKYLIIVNLYLTVALTAMQVSLQAGGSPQWLVTSYQWAAYVVVAILLVQVPFYAFVSMFWVVSQYIGFILETRQRTKQPLIVRQGSFYPG